MKNSFWCFVQYFWTCRGSFGYDDEWHADYGHFDAELKPESPYRGFGFSHTDNRFSPKKFLKVAFPYHLELHARVNKKYVRTKGYYLSVYLSFNSIQKKQIVTHVKVPSKKEAIRKSLEFIKEFEASEKPKLFWKEIQHRIPIINNEGVWIASTIIGSVSNALHKGGYWGSMAEAPLGYGDFYVLENQRGRWTWNWTHYSISGWGYSSSGCPSVPFNIWKAIQGFDPLLDVVLEQAIQFQQKNKFVMLNDKIGEVESSKFLNVFYQIQRNLP